MLRLVGAGIELDRIQRVEQRVSSGGGWLPGAIIGAIRSWSWPAGFSSVCGETNSCDYSTYVVTIAAGGFGAVAGGLIGAAIAPPKRT